MQNEISAYRREYESIKDVPRKWRAIADSLAEGKSVDDVCEIHGTRKDTIKKIVTVPVVRDHIAEVTLYKFGGLAPLAVGVIEELLKSDSQDIKLKAANSVLDRHNSGLFARRSKADDSKISVNVIGQSAIEDIRRKAMTIGTGSAVAATYEVVHESSGDVEEDMGDV